jgi:predicted  nucleic acid-binding Zn-ribbon protein
LDVKIAGLERKKSSLPEALKELDRQIAALQKNIATKTTERDEIEKGRRQAKAALDLNQDRLSRASGRLENVGNQQEFQAASKEMEQLKKSNEELSKQQTEFTAKIEAIGTEITGFEGQIAALQGDRSKAAQAVEGQVGELDGSLSEVNGQRREKVAGLRKDLVARYDRIRVARGGMGIVPATGGRCNGCNMHLPPQLFNQVQRGEEIHNCPSCHRILFMPGSGQ